jgi:TRAP-type uncharacterized transport system substrate-binding protein
MIRLLPIIGFALLIAACEPGSRELVLVRPAGEIDQEIAENMVELLGDESAINLVLTSDAMAGGDALQQLIEGRADVALISNDQPFRDDIATVMPLYATVLHVVYPNDRDPESFIDLMRNALVFAGQPGSASRRVFERLTSTVELGDEGFRFETGTAADVDLAVVFAPIAPDRLAEYPDVQLWSIGKPEDIGRGGPIDSLVLLNPHFRPFVIPVGTYGDAAADPVVTIAVDKLIIARSDLDRSVVYDLINELLRIRPALATIHPGLFQDGAGDFDVSRSRFVVHAGTQDYLQRSEPTFIERYSGVAEVLVTLMVASISAAFAGVRILNRRRKNRIDRFYKAALDIRNTAMSSTDIAERGEAVAQLRQLQDEAFAQLVEEKLAADESFRIFITLSNDIVRQLDSR